MEAMTPAKSAGIYVRISQDRGGLGLGVERQRDACQRLAADLGWTVAETYEDNDSSAYAGRKRIQYERMLEDLKSGRLDGVIAWDADRLHRQPKELEAFIDVVTGSGAAVRLVNQGHIDLTTASGQLQARFHGMMARYESQHRGERLRAKHVQNAQAGKPPRNSTRPYGLTDDWREIVPAEAELIREAVGRVLAGESLRSIAADWQARDIRTSTGGLWQPTPLRRMLTQARLAGIREHNGMDARRKRVTSGGTRTRGDWPAIIDEPTLEQLRAILHDPSRRTTTVNARTYLLSGFLACGKCGKPLRARPREDGTRRYVCASGPMFRGCGGVTVIARDVEADVADRVLYRLDTPAVAEAVAERPTTDTAGEAAALAADRAKLESLAADYGDDLIERAEWLAASKVIRERIEARAARLASATDAGVLVALRASGEDLRGTWESKALDWRRAVIGAMVERIVVGPAVRGRNTYDPERVTVGWRA